MSYRIPNIPDKAYASDSGSETDDSDDNCSDWASNFGEALRTKSLFDEEVFPTPEEAIAHDKAKHGVDVKEVKERLGLDVYGLMRLVNLIRGQVSLRSRRPTHLRSRFDISLGGPFETRIQLRD
jgi:protein arginine N-methyltransferase 3